MVFSLPQSSQQGIGISQHGPPSQHVAAKAAPLRPMAKASPIRSRFMCRLRIKGKYWSQTRFFLDRGGGTSGCPRPSSTCTHQTASCGCATDFRSSARNAATGANILQSPQSPTQAPSGIAGQDTSADIIGQQSFAAFACVVMASPDTRKTTRPSMRKAQPPQQDKLDSAVFMQKACHA